ncbi:MAG TPA: hypothetical protein PKA77_14390, partial [Chitinophagaceae bacterium]|nr:hypothetical protein [Chitinophagaceae bacterium]
MQLHTKRYWFLQVAGWGGFTLINIFFAYSFDQLETQKQLNEVLGRLSIFVALGLVLSHLMRLVIINISLLQKKLERQIGIFILVTFVFSIVGALIFTQVLQKYDLLNKREMEFLNNKVLLVLSGSFYFFVYFLIWNLLYFIYHYITKSRRQQLDALKMESLIKE